MRIISYKLFITLLFLDFFSQEKRPSKANVASRFIRKVKSSLWTKPKKKPERPVIDLTQCSDRAGFLNFRLLF